MDLHDLLAPFCQRPDRAGVVTDFDGTLAPIVDNPEAARALPGAVVTLHRLARAYRRVAVVSGRPASFLLDQLHLEHDDDTSEGEGLYVAGLYGMESASAGVVSSHPDCETWRPVVERIAAEAEEQMPEGVVVERKGLSVTLHYRTRPEAADWVRAWAAEAASRSGLGVHPARMSEELVPPIPMDKGRVVRELAEGLDAVCFLGDDVGDLPAFAALDDLRAAGVHTLKVVVRSAEAPTRLLDAGDFVVDGPEGALAVLRSLLPQSGEPGESGESGGAAARS